MLILKMKKGQLVSALFNYAYAHIIFRHGMIRKDYLFFKNFFNSIIGKNYKQFVFVDVGANDGWFAKSMLHFQPKLKIISFEPLKNPISSLEKITHIYKNFSYLPKAVGDKKGKVKIKEYKTSGLSSIKNLSKNYKYSDLHFDTSQINEYLVDIVTLNDILKNESKKIVLKIDTQGFELEVLKGARNLFKNGKIHCVIIELCTVVKYENQALDVEIINFLSRYGFILFDLKPAIYEDDSGHMTEYDAIFIKRF